MSIQSCMYERYMELTLKVISLIMSETDVGLIVELFFSSLQIAAERQFNKMASGIKMQAKQYFIEFS